MVDPDNTAALPPVETVPLDEPVDPDTASPAVDLYPGCIATSVIGSSKFMICDKCGLGWEKALARPACTTAGIARMRARLEYDIARHVASHDRVVSLRDTRDLPGDPLVSLQSAAELMSVLRFCERVWGNKAVMAQLRGKRVSGLAMKQNHIHGGRDGI